MAAADPDAVAADYAQFSDPGPAAERIVEKLPLNYLYLGAIRHALPEANILLLSRSPVECDLPITLRLVSRTDRDYAASKHTKRIEQGRATDHRHDWRAWRR